MLPDVYNSLPPDLGEPIVMMAPAGAGKERGRSNSVGSSGGGVASVNLPTRIPKQCVLTSSQDYQVNPLLLLAMIKVDGDMITGFTNPDGEGKALLERRRKYAPLVMKAASQTGVPAAFIDAVITAESSYRQDAISPKNAIGLMQLMPGTAKILGVNPKNDWENILGGSRYLAQLGEQFSWNLNLMLAAYNAGPAAVTKSGYQIPRYAETQQYVPKVMGIYAALANSGNDPASASFSTSAWAKKLEINFRIPREALANNICQALRGMAYAVKTEINNADGDMWRGVGNYYSDNSKYQQIYISRVVFAYKKMIRSGDF